jgi:hypothetical protein
MMGVPSNHHQSSQIIINHPMLQGFCILNHPAIGYPPFEESPGPATHGLIYRATGVDLPDLKHGIFDGFLYV